MHVLYILLYYHIFLVCAQKCLSHVTAWSWNAFHRVETDVIGLPANLLFLCWHSFWDPDSIANSEVHWNTDSCGSLILRLLVSDVLAGLLISFHLSPSIFFVCLSFSWYRGLCILLLVFNSFFYHFHSNTAKTIQNEVDELHDQWNTNGVLCSTFFTFVIVSSTSRKNQTRLFSSFLFHVFYLFSFPITFRNWSR